jgi:hypothetical protein
MNYCHRVVNVSYALRPVAGNATDGPGLVVAPRYRLLVVASRNQRKNESARYLRREGAVKCAKKVRDIPTD